MRSTPGSEKLAILVVAQENSISLPKCLTLRPPGVSRVLPRAEFHEEYDGNNNVLKKIGI